MKGFSRRDWLRKCATIGGGLVVTSWIRPESVRAAEGAGESGPSAAESAAIEEVVTQFRERFQVPGVSIAVARHGQFVHVEGYGMADQRTAEKVTAEHLFRIASVSKPITSAAIYWMLDEGKLKLNDLVFGAGGHLEADFGKLAGEFEKQITLHQLLTHSVGGWENEGNDPMFLRRRLNQRELIAWTLEHQPLKERPGQKYAYSNFGYCLLGRVLEKLSGQPYADFVQEAVLAKCGVRGMRIGGNTLAERAPLEVIYDGQNGGDPYGMNVRRMDAHGGWLATATDLVRFAMHVDGFSTTPNILTPRAVRLMTTGTAANTSYASGWSVNTVPNWWHEGSLPGTMSILVRTASGMCWAILANTRAKGMETAIDRLGWKIVQQVPAWRA